MTAPDPAAWQRAEAIAASFVRAAGPHDEPAIVARHTSIPFLFDVTVDPAAALVHRGRVVTERGIPALRAYLDDSHLLAAALPTSDDFLTLLVALAVWPATDQYEGVSPLMYLAAGADARLGPRLERHGDRVEFHLCYARGPRVVGGVRDPDQQIDVAQWTLLVEPGQDPLWTRTERIFSLARSAWVR